MHYKSIRTFKRFALVSLAVFCFNCGDGCDKDKDKEPTPECYNDDDCSAGFMCLNDSCVEKPRPECEELEGYCSNTTTLCNENYFTWATLECGGDTQTTLCCLPSGDCEMIGGYCEERANPCSTGYGAHYPMDCPNADSSKCCVPYVVGAGEVTESKALHE